MRINVNLLYFVHHFIDYFIYFNSNLVEYSKFFVLIFDILLLFMLIDYLLQHMELCEIYYPTYSKSPIYNHQLEKIDLKNLSVKSFPVR